MFHGSSLFRAGVLVALFGLLVGFAPGLSAQNVSVASKPIKPQKPPKGAKILFDGKDLSAWVKRGTTDQPAGWLVAEGEATVQPGTGDILTKEKFGDYQLHVEFQIPLMSDKHSQERGNSGVYQQGLFEVQVLDAYMNETYAKGGCGAIYEFKDPDKNACKPPQEWQTYDITFRAARFDAAGKMTEHPRITVLWNGVKVHDNVEITCGPTRASLGGDVTPTGPIMLQDHGCPVKFRNIWIKPLSEKEVNKSLPVGASKAP
ncbi:MAG TPA: DUF1080 domain-containing protein [Chthonomonadaceae bacterium]|nr:DUF1080 domain-containing protein [Chthonomonadaceae bacterium]